MKRHTMQIVIKKRRTDCTNFRKNLTSGDKKGIIRNKETLQTYIRVNSSKRQCWLCIYLITQLQNTWDRNDRSKRKKKYTHNYSWKLQVINKTGGQKTSKYVDALNNNKLEIIHIFKTLHSTIAEYTFFSNAQGNIHNILLKLWSSPKMNQIKRIFPWTQRIIQNSFQQNNVLTIALSDR